MLHSTPVTSVNQTCTRPSQPQQCPNTRLQVEAATESEDTAATTQDALKSWISLPAPRRGTCHCWNLLNNWDVGSWSGVAGLDLQRCPQCKAEPSLYDSDEVILYSRAEITGSSLVDGCFHLVWTDDDTFKIQNQLLRSQLCYSKGGSQGNESHHSLLPT